MENKKIWLSIVTITGKRLAYQVDVGTNVAQVKEMIYEQYKSDTKDYSPNLQHFIERGTELSDDYKFTGSDMQSFRLIVRMSKDEWELSRLNHIKQIHDAIQTMTHDNLKKLLLQINSVTKVSDDQSNVEIELPQQDLLKLIETKIKKLTRGDSGSILAYMQPKLTGGKKPRKSTKRKSTKRKSTKRKSTEKKTKKRKSTKKKSTKKE